MLKGKRADQMIVCTLISAAFAAAFSGCVDSTGPSSQSSPNGEAHSVASAVVDSGVEAKSNADDFDTAIASSFSSTASGASGPCAFDSVAPRFDPEMTFSPPIRITAGGTYSGAWRSLDPAVPAIFIDTKEPVTIQDSVVAGKGHLITGFPGAITVRNTKGFGLARVRDGERPGAFIRVETPTDVLIENNYLERVWGIRVDHFRGDPALGQTILVTRNVARNIEGVGAHFVQIAYNKNLENAELSWNEVINTPGESLVEDVINIFESSGTSWSPIRIHNNFIYGAFPLDPKATKFSGGGILLGDGGANSSTQIPSWVVAEDNQVVATSNYGMAIATGNNLTIRRNRVLASGFLADGSFVPSQNVGIYIWNINKDPVHFFQNVANKNLVSWNHRNPNSGQVTLNNYWLPDCEPGQCVENRKYSVPPSRLLEAEELLLWKQKLTTGCVRLGTTN